MNKISHSASQLFSSEFGNLSALVLKRLEVEWYYHQRPDLQSANQQLLHYVIEFGRLLNVVYRYSLFSALREECKWYVTVFGARGSRHDAFALVLDSWIMAIQGLLKPPECNELAQPLQSIRKDLDSVIAQVSTMSQASNKPVNPELLEKLICGDVHGAQEILSEILSTLASPSRMIVDVMLPVMAEIGRLWETNALEIFQEHLATEAIRSLLAGLMIRPSGEQPKNEAVALVSCVPGDEHELIPLALASYLRCRGWSVKNLGGGLPADQIARAVAVLAPNALFLSFTMLSRLEEVLDVIVKVRRESEQCRIILGGRGALLAKDLLTSRTTLVAIDFDQGVRLAQEGGSHA